MERPVTAPLPLRAIWRGPSAVTGWYGLTLIPGVPFEVPDRLRAKVRGQPHLFDILPDEPAPEAASPAPAPVRKPRSRRA